MCAVQVRGDGTGQLSDVAPRDGGRDRAPVPVMGAVTGPGAGGSSLQTDDLSQCEPRFVFCQRSLPPNFRKIFSRGKLLNFFRNCSEQFVL